MARRVLLMAILVTVELVQPVLAQIATDPVATGLRNPVAVVADPTHATSFFVVEQEGLVRIVRDRQVLGEPFLDLRSAIATGGERGLLGIALAPDFADSRRFFVNFTNRNGDTVIARFRRSETNPLRADPASRFDLMWPSLDRTIDQPFANHNGGHLAFGPDDYLYVGLGDGGSGGDPMNHAQNPRSLLGKMLRIDVAVPDDDPRGYRVPDDNPFVDDDPLVALREIWSFGLRNPWRYSFDDWTRGGTSALVLGDVGQDAREEINFEPAGAGGRNYGWRIREGRQAYDARTAAAFLPLREPILDYPRSQGASVTGGLIYRGAALDPSFNGRYFYGDFVSGRVFSIGLHIDPAGEAIADDSREHTEALGGRSRLGAVSSFGADHAGELLLLNYSAGTLLQVTPDFTLVPFAPTVTTAPDGDSVSLEWRPRTDGVSAAGYAVERVRDNAVTERLLIERTAVQLTWSERDCFRVRPQAANGQFGPPSPPACYSTP
jgi:glucose/arabinose dehydrogenase